MLTRWVFPTVTSLPIGSAQVIIWGSVGAIAGVGGRTVRRWYTLFTKPRCEVRVADILGGRDLEVFAPLIEYHGKRGDLLDKPFFPRYIFARFDWDCDGAASVQWTPGLTRVVTFDGHPAWLEDAQVDYLRSRLGQIDGDDFLRLKRGERVRVKSGPFRDLDAVFDKHLNGQARVAVLLHILGRKTRVILHAEEIARIA